MNRDLRDLPGPAPHYITVAMANSDVRSRRCAWPISGDHTTRARAARERINDDEGLSAYIHLATRRNV